MAFREKRRQQAQGQEDAWVDRVTLSTLCTSRRPYEEMGLVWGGSADNEALALRNLQRGALERGCDAVLGVAIYSAGSQRLFSARRRNDEWHAYGTGVRWLPA
ncbi:hypothetical protein [Actinomadura sp. 7K507]|uniref:hypothetical protein n=1 Tax=Actinomadura sp. 7K507 TaxID=2530365 RepID=UPI00104653A0|nr:hypothetical protein [Actinomadura sp. 7K507]TDC83610.1 hypothetical protein E1285_28475 [Actinomadura sp. 7K507]